MVELEKEFSHRSLDRTGFLGIERDRASCFRSRLCLRLRNISGLNDLERCSPALSGMMVTFIRCVPVQQRLAMGGRW